MNTIQKMVVLASLCLPVSAPVFAQTGTATNETISTADQLQKKWFYVDNDELKQQFTIDLDKGESLVVKFRKLSDWASPDDLKKAFAAADKVMAVYKDSISQEQNTQRIDIHIPAKQKNLISRYNQFNEAGNLMTINSDGASVLKLGIDTLRILQNKPGMVQIQYTFLLKSLSNYSTFAEDESLKNKIANKIDSIVVLYRGKWKNPNARSHSIYAEYNPQSNSFSYHFDRIKKGDQLAIEGGLGVSLVRNVLCPNAELGIGIYLGRSNESSTFVRLSTNAFYRFAEISPDRYKAYSTGFVNLEVGSESNHKDPKSLFYKTSFGFGYKLVNKKAADRDPSMDKKMYRLFFNYSINKFFVITPEYVTNFKKGDNKNHWFGLSLNVKIL